MKFVKKLDQFRPVPLEGCYVLAFTDGLGLKGDFAESSALVPVKEEKTVKSSNGGLGFVDAV